MALLLFLVVVLRTEVKKEVVEEEEETFFRFLSSEARILGSHVHFSFFSSSRLKHEIVLQAEEYKFSAMHE